MSYLEKAYDQYGEDLSTINGTVAMSGEGEWAVKTAEEINASVDIIKKSVEFRKKSHEEPNYTGKILTALRSIFGQHDIN